MIFQIIFIILLLLVTLMLSFRPDERVARILKDVKGFPTIPIMGNLHQLGFNGVDIFRNLNKLWEKSEYGTFKLVMGWKLAVFITEPALVETILGNPNEISKSDEYNILRNVLGNGLVTSEGDQWRKNRKLMTPAFHFKTLEQFVHIFNRNSMDILHCFSKELEKPVEIYEYFTRLTLNIIVESTLGRNIDTLNCHDLAGDKRDMALKYASAIYRYLIIIHLKMFTIINSIPLLYRMTQNYKDEMKCVEDMHSFCKEIIQERKLALKNEIEKTFINSDSESDMLLLTKNEDGTPLDDQTIFDEVNTIMSAGHETTSSLLSFCLFMLSRHPEIQQKVFDEQYSIFGDDKMKDVTTSDCADMKYLEMVIRETLRMFPSIPLIGRQFRNDITLKNGVVLPAGITTWVLISGVGNNPKYVKNPEVFDPERFTYDNFKGRHPYSFIPFSAGPRNCLGQKFAILEAKIILSKIIRNFEFYNKGIENHTLQLCAEVSLKSKNGVVVKMKQRKY